MTRPGIEPVRSNHKCFILATVRSRPIVFFEIYILIPLITYTFLKHKWIIPFSYSNRYTPYCIRLSDQPLYQEKDEQIKNQSHRMVP